MSAIIAILGIGLLIAAIGCGAGAGFVDSDYRQHCNHQDRDVYKCDQLRNEKMVLISTAVTLGLIALALLVCFFCFDELKVRYIYDPHTPTMATSDRPNIITSDLRYNPFIRDRDRIGTQVLGPRDYVGNMPTYPANNNPTVPVLHTG